MASQPQQIPEMEDYQKYQTQVVDIFFGKRDYGPIMQLVDIKNMFIELNYQVALANSSEDTV